MFRPMTFGKFYLYEKLAIGGMAEIFKAKLYGIAGFEKTLVVKLILPEYAGDPEFVKMFIDEANIAVSLSHGNIVPIFELGKIGEQYYIAMEFVDGENLETIIDEVARLRREIPIPKAVEICIEVLKGLDFAHRRVGPDGRPLGIVHRDVSPQNVMVSFDGEVKIVDFGIAKAAAKLSLTHVGTLKGKFGYMSPEQASGAEIDGRADLYSVGIVLWEMLTSKRLFEARTDLELLRKAKAGNAPVPSEVAPRVPPELDRILARALANDVSERYAHASQFQLALQRWLYSRSVAEREESLAEWMRGLFGKGLQAKLPRATAPPVPPPQPPAAAGAPPRRAVSFARNSQIVRMLEEAEALAEQRALEARAAPREEPSVSRPSETLESPEDTLSVSISVDVPRPPARPEAEVTADTVSPSKRHAVPGAGKPLPPDERPTVAPDRERRPPRLLAMALLGLLGGAALAAGWLALDIAARTRAPAPVATPRPVR